MVHGTKSLHKVVDYKTVKIENVMTYFILQVF